MLGGKFDNEVHDLPVAPGLVIDFLVVAFPSVIFV